MHLTIRSMMLGLGVWALVGALGGCSVDTDSSTGIRINVRFDETVPPDDAAGLIDTLRFYVAVQHPDHPDVYVLNDAADGIVVDVADHDLVNDSYRLLIGENGDGEMETIRVVVVGERAGSPVLVGQLLDPPFQQFQAGQIVQRTIWLRPAGQDFSLTWTVTDCLMSSHAPEEGELVIRFGTADDLDCDGYLSEAAGGDDCDDTNPFVNPGAQERHDCDGIDNDCDGITDPGGHDDFDGDGYTACDGDCDDEDDTVYPGAPELCDGKDNDCNGKCDGPFDNDGDGFTTCNSFLDHETGLCVWVPTPDCDDNDDSVHPGAVEECNGKDDNCNGLCDEGLDPDGDGYTWCGSKSGPPEVDPVPGNDECLEPNVEHEDCAPDDPTVSPGAPELCDDLDNNCDGQYSDMQATCYVGSPESECRAGQMSCIESGNGGDLWSACSGGGELVPGAYCGIWPNCAQAPDPDTCMALSVQHHTLSCSLHYMQGFYELCGGSWERPIYYLPFGFSGNAGCQWHLMLENVNAADWDEVGLVPPNNPAATAGSTVLGCEAALVVQPTINGEPPPLLSGTISFFYDNGGGDYFALEMPFTIEPANGCTASYESLVCTI